MLEAVEIAVRAGARAITSSAHENGTDIVVDIVHDGVAQRVDLEAVSDRVDASQGVMTHSVDPSTGTQTVIRIPQSAPETM